MSVNSVRKTLYILGAGCSKKSGYPLATDFISELDSYWRTLGDKALNIKQCFEETVGLMRQVNVSTIDDLVVRLHSGSLNLPAKEQQIKKAKLATEILLLAKENSARRMGANGYHGLLRESCPIGGNWNQRLRRSHCQVLTFNYDRLLEMALLDLIEPDLKATGIYGNHLLNSGFNTPFGDDVSFADEGFCYLKLHGSIGMNVSVEYSVPQYGYNYADIGQVIEPTDEKFLPGQPNPRAIFQSLGIIFLNEKHHVQAGGTHLAYEKYIKAIWGKAKDLVAEAAEIYVIGYSFHALDKHSIIELLSEAKGGTRGIVQNLPGVTERICSMLKAKHPGLPIQWEPYPEAF